MSSLIRSQGAASKRGEPDVSTMTAPEDLAQLKASQRESALAIRRARSHVVQGASAQIAHRLMRWTAHHASFARVAIYIALPGEPSCAQIAQDVVRHGGRVFAPRMRPDEHDLDLVELLRFSSLRQGRWGIFEPHGEVCPASLPDLILVPGLRFDTSGGRLGFGKGYYDRFLARARSSGRAPLVLGVCDEALLTDTPLPMGRLDERMDGVLTQDRLICWNKRGYGLFGGREWFENHSPRLDIPCEEADKRGAQRDRGPLCSGERERFASKALT